MFLLDGKPLSPDQAFTDSNGIQRPANWLRLASPEERLEAGITEVPDPPQWDQRFYWGYDQDGQLIPKDHAQLVEQWSAQTKQTANTLLASSDWMVVRELDNGTPVPTAWKTWREDVRLATGTKLAAIAATLDTTELATYLSGSEYSLWPLDPSQPLPPAPPDEPADAQPLESASSPSTEVSESVQTDPELLNAPVA
jgi:hypothetical protein